VFNTLELTVPDPSLGLVDEPRFPEGWEDDSSVELQSLQSEAVVAPGEPALSMVKAPPPSDDGGFGRETVEDLLKRKVIFWRPPVSSVPLTTPLGSVFLAQPYSSVHVPAGLFSYFGQGFAWWYGPLAFVVTGSSQSMWMSMSSTTVGPDAVWEIDSATRSGVSVVPILGGAGPLIYGDPEAIPMTGQIPGQHMTGDYLNQISVGPAQLETNEFNGGHLSITATGSNSDTTVYVSAGDGFRLVQCCHIPYRCVAPEFLVVNKSKKAAPPFVNPKPTPRMERNARVEKIRARLRRMR
jgi:hypothetical protein